MNKMSLQTTSTIKEVTMVNKCVIDDINNVFEESLGNVVVLSVQCDVNTMLGQAGVVPGEECAPSIDLDAVGRFEHVLKTQWSEFGSPKKLYQQVRSFLGDFFDHDKELNATVAQNMSANPRAVVFMDDQKIRHLLKDLGTPTGSLGERTFVSLENPSPINRGCFATCLLSVRQVADCLRSFAQLNQSGSFSRVTQDSNGQSVFQLWPGDSIIGECMVFDSDAVSTDKQYSQVIKVQILQT